MRLSRTQKIKYTPAQTAKNTPTANIALAAHEISYIQRTGNNTVATNAAETTTAAVAGRQCTFFHLKRMGANLRIAGFPPVIGAWFIR
jgi:hypothetical protein